MAEGILISERSGIAIASLIARRGRLDELCAAVRDAWRTELPLTPHVAEGDGASFIWAGPERWLVALPSAPDELVTSLRARADGLAAVCDQSDGCVLLRVSGRFARDALAKGVPVDLHPSVFTPGSTAITVAAYVGCQIWQIDDAPTYDIAVPRSFAASFRDWLAGTAAAFDIKPSPPLGTLIPPALGRRGLGEVGAPASEFPDKLQARNQAEAVSHVGAVTP